jgi:FKBP-type peptidyl-prolyl cis-trans isomerase FkpA
MKKRFRTGVVCLSALSFVIGSCMMKDSEDFPDFQEQMAADVAAIDSYLASKNLTAVEHSTGIRYIIHDDVAGDHKPTIDSCVTANYVGRLLSNEQTFDEGKMVSFPLNAVIDGWKIGIPLLSVGDSATFYIPSGLGYGIYGFPPEIPGNAVLIFHVGLANVGKTYKSSDRSCN